MITECPLNDNFRVLSGPSHLQPNACPTRPSTKNVNVILIFIVKCVTANFPTSLRTTHEYIYPAQYFKYRKTIPAIPTHCGLRIQKKVAKPFHSAAPIPSLDHFKQPLQILQQRLDAIIRLKTVQPACIIRPIPIVFFSEVPLSRAGKNRGSIPLLACLESSRSS